MQELNAAWAILSDTGSRQAYDAGLARQRVAGGTSPIVAGRREKWKPLDPTQPPAPRPDLGPVVADESDMELRGPAKFLRPAPLLAIAVVIFGLIILASVAGTSRDGSTERSNVPVAQPTGVPLACITLVPITEEVPCGAHDAVVWSVVDANTQCPSDLESIYRQSVGGLYCVTRVE